MSPRPACERVVEVRIEAPEYVDDTVVRYADRHREWIQAKEALNYGGEPWKKLWKDYSAQRWDPSFGSEDRRVLVLGTRACRHLADSQAWLELLPDAADSG
jgi:hypothetical protein